MTMNRRALLVTAALPSLLSSAGTAFAQARFPARPIKLVIPFASGGSNDFIGRQIAPRLGASIGQPVVVENRAGAGGAVGAQAVAQSAPDGHTILMHSITMVIQPYLVKAPGYDFRADFIPVTQLTQAPLVLLVHPSVPARTVPEFLAYARAKGSDLFFGSAGNGSTQHLTGELFNSMTGAKMKHVPFRGNGPATAALLAGDIQAVFDIIPTALSLGQTGRIRPIAVTGRMRNAVLPNLPTIHESGVPGFIIDPWVGLFLPRGTPAAVVQQWLGAARATLADREVQARLTEQGYQTGGPSLDELASFMDAEYAKWGKVVAAARITPE